VAAQLIASGWARETPAAVIVEASTPRQQVWRGRLEELAVTEPPLDPSGPGTIVVGAVAAMELVNADGSACGRSEAPEGSPAEPGYRATASGGGAPRVVRNVGQLGQLEETSYVGR